MSILQLETTTLRIFILQSIVIDEINSMKIETTLRNKHLGQSLIAKAL